VTDTERRPEDWTGPTLDGPAVGSDLRSRSNAERDVRETFDDHDSRDT
jgi:hypothetical protein